ncbi:serine/threonine protein kinase [Nonomuraea sp. KC401]|uniref:serine/threonine protein kinase n=1 Tax=unclassified Nonomuraea TaxID=2593643 RepID=UPI0010FEE58C|nr:MULTISPECIES: serine/threonine-protein kinase [unclassified Nonomuraea]NBE99421.1 protein kinase [Nonomuraea sp. K271]TLF57393.1 serine/threonine protein kinase [Nonomuraea sp. KC401]
MPSFTPLVPGDPPELGGLELLGRLGEGGQGVVYLASTPAGAHVAVKWLRADQADDERRVQRFLREAQVAKEVAPFCTAVVLDTGVAHDRPYIVSQYVEGPSLEQVVRDEGPLTGAALDRLAIGTAAALVAIHEGDVVHRDFKPGNVIMAGDGPRVIDFGIARTLDPVQMTSSTQIGTPAYMSPEQVLGRPVGPAADMFSWAATIVFASCGRAPFGHDGHHAVTDRVLNEPPDLGTLDGPLREVAERCLAKDPAERLTAQQVIMRLLRRPQAGADPLREETWEPPEEDAPEPVRPAERTRRPVTGMVAAAVALVLVSGAAGVAVGRAMDEPSPVAARPATLAPSGTPEPVRTEPPGGRMTLYESPSDPIRLTAYEVQDKKADTYVDYARLSLDGTFEKYPGNAKTLVSPDGRYLAERPKLYTDDDYSSVLLTNREAGTSFRVRTVRKPRSGSLQAWSRDGTRILLTITEKVTTGKGEEEWPTVGFAVLTVDQNDLARSSVSVIDVPDEAIREHDFVWGPGERSVVSLYGDDEGLRFFDFSGRRVRDVPDVGTPPFDEAQIFSPSGSTFVTDCPSGHDGDHCLWESATGKQVRAFSSDCDTVLGWYDETHLYCWERDNASTTELRVVDFAGKLVRKLIEVRPGPSVIVHYTLNPATTS